MRNQTILLANVVLVYLKSAIESELVPRKLHIFVSSLGPKLAAYYVMVAFGGAQKLSMQILDIFVLSQNYVTFWEALLSHASYI